MDYGDETLGKLMMQQLQDLIAARKNSLPTNASVTERYGKWKNLLEPNSSLSLLLHTEGSRGLQIFGYEPRKKTLYDGPSTTTTNLTYTCSAAVACPENTTGSRREVTVLDAATNMTNTAVAG